MNVLNNTVRKEIIELLLDENRSDLSFYTVLVLGIKVHEIKIIDSALTALLKYPFLSEKDLIHNNQLVEDDMQTILGGFDNFVQLTGIEPKSFDQWLREKPDGKSVVISRTIYERYLYTIENFVGTGSGHCLKDHLYVESSRGELYLVNTHCSPFRLSPALTDTDLLKAVAKSYQLNGYDLVIIDEDLSIVIVRDMFHLGLSSIECRCYSSHIQDVTDVRVVIIDDDDYFENAKKGTIILI